MKICTQENNEKNFEKELYFYDLLKNEIPVPNVLFHDFSKEIIDKYFMIYEKIDGCNLYSKWHQFNDVQKKNVIKQICDILKKINYTSYEDFANRFNLDTNIDWHKEKYSNIKECLEIPSLIDQPPGCKFHTRCPYAEDICSKKVPELREISENHFIACHTN